MATHSRILAWRIPWTEEPDRLEFMGSQRVGHDYVTNTHTHTHTHTHTQFILPNQPARYRQGHNIGNNSKFLPHFKVFCPSYLSKTSAIRKNLAQLPGGVSYIFRKKNLGLLDATIGTLVYEASLISCLASWVLPQFHGAWTWIHLGCQGAEHFYVLWGRPADGFQICQCFDIK